MHRVDQRGGLVKVGVNSLRALGPLGPAELPRLLSRCHVTPPSVVSGTYGTVVFAASCYVSMIPGQGLFVVTPSGIEHSRSHTGVQGAQEETDKTTGNRGPRPGPRPASAPQNDPDRLPALVAACLKPAPDAP